MRGELNKKIDVIVKMYYEDLKPLRQIASELGFTATGIQKVLNRHGYDTSKEALNLDINCTYCKKVFKKLRADVRSSIDNFCSQECYRDYLKILNEENVIDRYSQIKSRRIVENIFGSLPKGSVVHHIDGDDTNIEIPNLMLLASQGDHIMVHRKYGSPVILWDGRNYTVT